MNLVHYHDSFSLFISFFLYKRQRGRETFFLTVPNRIVFVVFFGFNYSPWFQSVVMRPFVSQHCIRTELISVFAIRGKNTASLIPVAQLKKVSTKWLSTLSSLFHFFSPLKVVGQNKLIDRLVTSLSPCSFFNFLQFNMRSLSIFYIIQDFRRIYLHSHQRYLELVFMSDLLH